MPDYLLEIRSQEMSAQRLVPLLRRLATRLFEDLMSLGLPPDEIATAGTLRRLAVTFLGLPEKERDRHEEELGPPLVEAWDDDGRASEALIGFAERVGVDAGAADLRQSFDELFTTVQTERGEYVGRTRDVAGRPIAEVLGAVVPRALADLLRESDGAFASRQWIRPVTGLVSLLDGEVLPLRLDGVDAGDTTVVHTFTAPDRVAVTGWRHYLETLAGCGVVGRIAERQETVKAALCDACRDAGGSCAEDEDLLRRLTALVEIPGAVHGRFDPEFLALPRELVTASLAHDLDAFAVEGENGDLLPAFATIVDGAVDDSVRHGLERACAGTLADLRFHVDNDRRVPLAERVQWLEQRSLHERLGTWADKGERLQQLVEAAVDELASRDGDDSAWSGVLEAAQQAAMLLKADLTTAVVEHYPELRGTVGGLYARDEGYVEPVWQAIYDHYAPAAPDQPIPRGAAGRVLAAVDRLDSLVGFLGIAEEVPTSSRDPFAQRRRATGLLHIVIDAGMEFDLELLAARAALLYGDRLDRGAQEIVRDLHDLLDDRLTYLLGQRGFAYDEIEAAKAVGMSNLPDLVQRLDALHGVRDDPGFPILVQAAKRIANMVIDTPDHEVDEELLEQDAEIELHQLVVATGRDVQTAAEERRYVDCLSAVLKLAPQLDRFFAEVLVKHEDERLRANRLAILQECRRLYWKVARLKALEVEGG